MLNYFKQSTDLNKASYIYHRHLAIREIMPFLEEQDPDVKIVARQKEFMRQGKFSWQQEVDLMGVNLTRLINFLQEFYAAFNTEIDKQFGMTRIFQELFPLETIYLYFRNQNFQYGHHIYDGSLRIKSLLMFCLNDLYLNSDFRNAFRIQFKNRFDFDAATRNYMRESNRQEIARQYN